MLAAKLIERLADGNAGNVSVSPMSVAAALSAIAMGADPGSRRSFEDALQMRQQGAAGDSLEALLKSSTSLAGGAPGGAASPLVVADRLVLDGASGAKPEVLAKLKNLGVQVAEEKLDDPAIVDRLNAWVKETTRGLIPAIIDKPPGAGGVVALNALYFKDRWSAPFDPAATAPAEFHTVDGATVSTPMMRQGGRFLFRRGETLIGADLRFADERFGLVLVTNTGKPATAKELLGAAGDWLTGEQFGPDAGEIAIPRLETSGSADLLGPMQSLGLRDEALNGFGSASTRIAAIAQRTVLKLDEQGAEAAAATAIGTTKSMRTSVTRMVLDRPFLFALRDRTTGFVLLAGYVGRPTAPST